MDIRYLETVLAVAKHCSFSIAAEEIPCSQSSVSRQVNEVERALGYTLFNRSPKLGVIGITDKGQLVIPQIEELVNRFRNIFGGKKSGPYRLGLFLGLFSFKAKHNITSHVFTKHPELDLLLVDVEQEAWINMLSNKQIDGMLYHMIVDNQSIPDLSTLERYGLNFTFLKEQCLSVAFPKTHPMANRESVSLSDLKEETFLFTRATVQNGEGPQNSHDTSVWNSCAHAGFLSKTTSLAKKGFDFADVRDVVIEARGWIYPTYQFKSWCYNENVRLVPVNDSLYSAHYYFVTLSDKNVPQNTEIRQCLNDLCNMKEFMPGIPI